MDETVAKFLLRNTEHLKILADTCKYTCPALSNLFRVKKVDIERRNAKALASKTKQNLCPVSKLKQNACEFCGNIFNSHNCTTRVKPRMKMTKKLRQLLNKYTKNPTTLGKYQSNLVQTYLNSSNFLIKKCSVCKKQNKIPCQSRYERSVQTTASKKPQENEVKLKTGKEKKKEKKKQRKKQKMIERREELSSMSDTSLLSDVSLLCRDTSTPMAFSTPRNVPILKQSSSYISVSDISDRSQRFKKSLTDFSTPGSSKTDDSLGSLSSGSTKSKISKSADSAIGMETSDSTKNLKSPNPTAPVFKLITSFSSSQPQVTKSEKKKKMKNMHQQLNKILAKEKKNISSSGSLSDFLSSL